MFVKKQYLWGYLLVLNTLLITYAIWIGTMWYLDDWYDDAFKYPAKVGSMGTTLLMCWAFILSTRFKLVEYLFGELDKVYKAHRRIGELAFFLIFLHPVFLGWHLLPDWQSYARYFWFSPDWARNTGILSLVLFTVLVGLSIWITLQYHRWKQTPINISKSKSWRCPSVISNTSHTAPTMKGS